MTRHWRRYAIYVGIYVGGLLLLALVPAGGGAKGGTTRPEDDPLSVCPWSWHG